MGAGLIIKSAQEFPIDDPIAMKYVRPYLGPDEVVNGLKRWCIWAPDGLDPGDRQKSALLNDRLTQVMEQREASDHVVANELAKTPTEFFHNAQPTTDYVGIPAQVSETRRWYTVAHFTPNEIASNTLYAAEDPTGFLFAVLSSTMFMAWVAGIGGRPESRLRYAKSIVHNTSPSRLT